MWGQARVGRTRLRVKERDVIRVASNERDRVPIYRFILAMCPKRAKVIDQSRCVDCGSTANKCRVLYDLLMEGYQILAVRW